ncbi:ATP-binding cassette domain-containing protein [Nostocoides sp. Soil756]|jgi:ABC-2 type transport system ATP-binding protein|uniref:ABC transporter ATP-binding protein n=1 Tax=Nostocoides sp. Soil756 TaxID=1736399 RepID=UPI0006F1D0D2|nr:ATP-binding cassette domain-containing protein [Tetrasphaera sp. Soil756]KRE63446.1 ABC transporter ATP-binding protein [Tetrasphaera sp. Soil756]
MLEIRELTRRFGDVTAVDGVSFDVRDGILTGFVGGNGAGKTTTMRMVMGVLAVDAGEVRWQGRTVTAADQRRFGYMPEERGLYPKQRVLDQLVYLAQLKGMAAETARRAALEHLERFGLAERAGDQLQKLSLGNQQRVQVVAALLHDPAALVLDEPFSGLDPTAVDSMADLLRERAATGVPVLFSSHQLDLVEKLCDRLVILSRGRVVAAGDADELRSRGPVRYRLTLDRDAGWVRDLGGIHVVDVDGRTALVEVIDDGAEQHVLREATARGTVRDFTPVRPALADIYREVAA